MPRPTPSQRRASPQSSQVAASGESSLRFDLQNWVLLLAGLACIVLGFVLLARGSVTAAPLLVVLGYVGLVPFGILRRGA